MYVYKYLTTQKVKKGDCEEAAFDCWLGPLSRTRRDTTPPISEPP